MKKEMKKVNSKLTWWVGLKREGRKWVWKDGGDFSYRIT